MTSWIVLTSFFMCRVDIYFHDLAKQNKLKIPGFHFTNSTFNRKFVLRLKIQSMGLPTHSRNNCSYSLYFFYLRQKNHLNFFFPWKESVFINNDTFTGWEVHAALIDRIYIWVISGSFKFSVDFFLFTFVKFICCLHSVVCVKVN